MSLYSNLLTVLTPYANKIKQNEIDIRTAMSLSGGAPIVVGSASAMTDTDQIYVLSTDGKWYYHNGSAWVAGGEYGAVSTDRTLSEGGIPADAKKTGDKLIDLESAIIDSRFATILTVPETLIPFNIKRGESVTISTIDGTTFVSGMSVLLYNSNKTRFEYFGLNGYGNKRTVTLSDVEQYDCFYITLSANPSNQSVLLTNNSVASGFVNKTLTDEVGLTNTKVTELQSNVSILQEVYYQTEITKDDGLIPFIAVNGDTISVETTDESIFQNDQLRFYDANKTYIDYWSLRVSDGKKRTFIYNKTTEARFISLAKVGSVVKTYHVVNESSPYYVTQYNPLSILKYLPDKNNDISSLKKNSNVNLMFFSDIHAGSENLSRIIEFAENVGGISAVINGGDTVQSYVSDSVSWYDNAVNQSSVPVLNCIGNHDMWSSYWVSANKKDVYDKFIAPVATNVPSIVQPVGASENGLNYYYVDFGDLRIIVLAAMITGNDSMYWDSAQKTWLESVLADAKTNSKYVVCVNHSPFNKADAIIDYDSPLNSWKVFNSSSFDAIHLAPEAVSAVSDFINGNGNFVCWLTGHTHNDYLMTETNASRQFMINIASAKYSNHADGFSPTATAYGETNYDCFDVIGIDLTNKILKVLRIGFNEDAAMKIRNRFSYDFANSKLLSQS